MPNKLELPFNETKSHMLPKILKHKQENYILNQPFDSNISMMYLDGTHDIN
jgi:hypothetical protein